jgi:tetratricopeptide (TPR) repeat protein
MARILLFVTFIMLVTVQVGCYRPPREETYFVPPLETSPAIVPMKTTVKSGEIDIVEHLTASRHAYRQALASLVDYYSKAGNHMKLTWAEKEFKGLTTIPQYRYLFEAELAGPDLRATKSISEADKLFNEALNSCGKAKEMMLFVDDKQLRSALDKFNQLIIKYPSSDKIDDAAFRAGEIYEHFKEYSIAAVYYNRAYQWDPETNYPARFKTAYVLDKYLRNRIEALPLYQQSMEIEVDRHPQYKNFVERRIRDISSYEQVEK